MAKPPAPPVPPEGQLIVAALKRQRLSGRRAAERAGVSPTRWHQIVNGYQTVNKQRVPLRGPAETVARMAHVVGVSPEELEAADRSDAAKELRLITRGEAPPPAAPEPGAVDESASVFADPTEREIWGMRSMSAAERADHIATVRVRRVTSELRAENEALRREIAQLRFKRAS